MTSETKPRWGFPSPADRSIGNDIDFLLSYTCYFSFSFYFLSLIWVPGYPQAHVHSCLKTRTEPALYLLLQKSSLHCLQRLGQPYAAKQQPHSSAGPGAGIIVPKKKNKSNIIFSWAKKRPTNKTTFDTNNKLSVIPEGRNRKFPPLPSFKNIPRQFLSPGNTCA